MMSKYLLFLLFALHYSEGRIIYVFVEDTVSDNQDTVLRSWNQTNGGDIRFVSPANETDILSDLLTKASRKENTSATTPSCFVDLRESPSLYACYVAEALEVPYIVSTPRTMHDCQPIRVRPSVTDYVEASIASFEARNPDLKEIIFLLDEDIEFNTSVLRRPGGKFLEIMIFPLDLSRASDTLYQFLTDGNTQLFVVVGSIDSTTTLIQKLARLSIYRMDFWAITALDSLHCPTSNISHFSYICVNHEHSDNRTMNELVLKHIMDTTENFISTNGSVENMNKTEDNISSIDIITMTSIELTYGKKVSSKAAKWTRKSGLEIINRDSLFGPIPNMEMRVVLIHEPPFIIRVPTANGTTYTGYTIDVLNELAKRLNFSYVATEVPDEQYGVKLPDGTWTGIIGQVAKGASDLGVGPISVTAERETVIDFTAPYYDYAGLQIVMRDPKGPKSLFIFTTVFTNYVWLAWFSLLIGTAFLLYGYHRFRSYMLSKGGEETQPILFDLKDSFWFVMASITLAGPERTPVTFSSRLLVAGFWFFCQIMMATYTANLAAFMTSSRLNTPIESLEDLATQSGVRYSALAGSVSETYFTRMAKIEDSFYDHWKEMSYYSSSEQTVNDYAVWDYPLGDRYSKILSVINTTGYVNNSRQGIDKVMEGDFAFVHETPMIKFEMSRMCGLMTVGSPFSSKPYAFVLPENSPLVESFSTTILKLQSETILARLKEKWWANGNSTCSTTDESSGLTLETLGGIFIVTAGGCVLGYIILAIEIFVERVVKHRKGKDQKKEGQYHVNGNSSLSLNDYPSMRSLQTASSQADLLY